MRLSDYTTERALLPGLVVRDLDTAVKRLAGAMAAGGLVRDPALLARDVMRREAEGGTALASGIVLPHATSQAARRVTLGLATLAQPVSALDSEGEERRVDVVVLLTAPPGESRAMLRMLARLAREIRGGLLDRLRRAASASTMAALLRASETGRP
jgi:mannitol/fructose-specific phosphotransferase system IIA component (Ntr-type)